MNANEAIVLHVRGKQRIEKTGTAVVPDAPLKIVYAFWRATQSEYHYREVGEFDLGEIE